MGASPAITRARDDKIIKGVLAGKSAREIGREVYPAQSENNARVSVAKRLSKVTVQSNLDQALLKHGLTIQAALKPIQEALKATKREKQGDDWIDVPDLNIRLKAADRVLALLDRARITRAPDIAPEQIQAIASASDEVELQRIVFRQE